MLKLEKIIASLLTPPGLLVLLQFLLTLLIFKYSRKNILRNLSVIILLILIVFTTAIGVRIFLFPLENTAEEMNVEPGEPYPIVIMGGGIYYDKGDAKPGLHSIQRLSKGYQVYQKLKTPLIYSGGVGIGQSGMSEADVAANWLINLGIPPEDYIAEDQARTTYENGLFIQEWTRKNNYNKVYLVTSAVHMLRSRAVLNSQGIEVLSIHSGFLYSHRLSWLDYLPNRGALYASLSAVHEWLGLVWYRITGRI